MTRLRPKTGIATAAALAFALSACGGGSDYCDALTAAEDKYRDTGDLDPTDVEALSEAQDAIAEVAASAPDEVQDAWQDAADAFQMLVDATATSPLSTRRRSNASRTSNRIWTRPRSTLRRSATSTSADRGPRRSRASI